MEKDKHRVLLIEDNSADAHIIDHVLSKVDANVNLIRTENGESALQILETQGDSRSIDLIILDLNLPKLDGGEFLSILRANPATCELPVAILSSTITAQQKLILEPFAPAAYLEKPLDIGGFMDIGKEIKNLLERLNTSEI